MRTLICGSMAYDNIMVFPDYFKNHILPEKIHMLSVSFLVPEMRREFGGCAGNIAYNLHLLGGAAIMMSTVGSDFAPYEAHCKRLGLDLSGIKTIDEAFTGQCFITTDLDDNQITAFHPGAMSFSHLSHVEDLSEIGLGIVAPDGREGMLQHAREFSEANIPFILDPGQGMPMFSGSELLQMLEWATYLTLNDYEAELMQERTGLNLEQLATRVKALIVTQGGQGSTIYADGQVHQIPAVQADQLLDPTGCGDAYRAGLLYGIAKGWGWDKTGRLASLLGAIKIASRGGQNHHFSRDSLAERFQSEFGRDLWAD